MKTTKIRVICINLILLFAVSGCSSYVQTPSALTSAPITPIPTATPAIIEALTPEPTPEPTPTIDPVIAQIYISIDDYLNKKGEYRYDSVLEKAAIDTAENYYAKDTKFGLVDLNPTIQGIFLDYLEKDDSLILFMGFQYKDNNRFVSPLEIPIYFLNRKESVMNFRELEANFICSPIVEWIVVQGNGNEVSERIKNLKGKVIAFGMRYDAFTEEEIEAARRESGGTLDPTAERYVQSQREKAGIVGKLVSSLATNGVDLSFLDKNYSEERFENYKIVIIEDIEDIQYIKISEIPLVDGMIWTWPQ